MAPSFFVLARVLSPLSSLNEASSSDRFLPRAPKILSPWAITDCPVKSGALAALAEERHLSVVRLPAPFHSQGP